MPLNEECGLLEWVNNTIPFRNIVDKAYARQGKKLYVSVATMNLRDFSCLFLRLLQTAEVYQAIEAARKKTPQDAAKVFQREVLT
jgi:phosphatidylinositol kinase/protein kinase (PI-3  family)